MNYVGVPDMLTAGQNSRSVAKVSQDLTRVSQELSSGLKSNLVKASGGDPAALYGIESDLSRNEARNLTVTQASNRASVTQSALGRVQNAVGVASTELLAAVTMDNLASAEVISSAARSAFSDVISALNSRFGERSLFAGAATNGVAVTDGDTILDDLVSRISGATDVDDVIAIVDDYFSANGDYVTTQYLGSNIDAPEVELDNGELISFAIRADADAIRDTLSALALAVVGSEGGFPGDGDDARLLLMERSARRGIEANDSLIFLQSNLGVAEQRFEEASIRIEAEETILQQARNAIIVRDPFEAATELTSIETQLQAIFAITARLSALTLTNFLR